MVARFCRPPHPTVRRDPTSGDTTTMSTSFRSFSSSGFPLPFHAFVFLLFVGGSLDSVPAAIVTDTFTRETIAGWGSVDNGMVNGDVGLVPASYVLDGAGTVTGGTGRFTNSRIVLDYNLAADATVIAAGGFVVEFSVNPGDGDIEGTGREFAGIALSDSNANPPYGGAGAITNQSNTTLRYALLPRNSGSAGLLTRTAGDTYNLLADGNPDGGINETVFDQDVFDAYSASTPFPDPFVNDQFYDVRMVVLGDFSEGSDVLVTSTVNGTQLQTETIEWGVGGQAYLSAIAFNGPHQYDNLRVAAVPEPSAMAMLAIGCVAVTCYRRRSTT